MYINQIIKHIALEANRPSSLKRPVTKNGAFSFVRQARREGGARLLGGSLLRRFRANEQRDRCRLPPCDWFAAISWPRPGQYEPRVHPHSPRTQPLVLWRDSVTVPFGRRYDSNVLDQCRSCFVPVNCVYRIITCLIVKKFTVVEFVSLFLLY